MNTLQFSGQWVSFFRKPSNLQTNPYNMQRNSKLLERLLDLIAEDIFDDVENAKAVINEAGYDATLSLNRGKSMIRELDEEYEIITRQLPETCNNIKLQALAIRPIIFSIPEDAIQEDYDGLTQTTYSEKNNCSFIPSTLLNARYLERETSA